jgi:hypothetical protein
MTKVVTFIDIKIKLKTKQFMTILFITTERGIELEIFYSVLNFKSLSFKGGIKKTTKFSSSQKL